MSTVLWVIGTNALTMLVMYRIMWGLPGVLEAKAYEERIAKLPWQEVKWLQESGSAAVTTNDPRAKQGVFHRMNVTGRKPSFGIKVSGEAEIKVN